mmetsp:Transcript_13814/g.54763  ORF Transcript_13814/g.54763 Transcript_13814/m.54763 type:complete len:268 (-) Transcript_13814:824-1627(-)
MPPHRQELHRRQAQLRPRRRTRQARGPQRRDGRRRRRLRAPAAPRRRRTPRTRGHPLRAQVRGRRRGRGRYTRPRRRGGSRRQLRGWNHGGGVGGARNPGRGRSRQGDPARGAGDGPGDPRRARRVHVPSRARRQRRGQDARDDRRRGARVHEMPRTGSPAAQIARRGGEDEGVRHGQLARVDAADGAARRREGGARVAARARSQPRPRVRRVVHDGARHDGVLRHAVPGGQREAREDRRPDRRPGLAGRRADRLRPNPGALEPARG